MSSIDHLASLFMKFPGIGTRQARRFVYFLLARDPRFLETLAREIANLQHNVHQCTSCFRYYPRMETVANICIACGDEADEALLMVVEKDSDFESVRKSGVFSGRYFILGGTLPILGEDPASKIRINELVQQIQKKGAEGLSEVILALSANPDGDTTREYVLQTLAPLSQEYGFTISSLGRGLSTGSELEYSDSDTLRHALKNRG